jgi:hypothetical protein
MSALTLEPGAPVNTATRVRGVAVVSTLLEVFHEPAATYEYYRIRVLPGARQISPAHPSGVTEHLTVYKGQVTAGPVGAPLTGHPGEYLTWYVNPQCPNGSSAPQVTPARRTSSRLPPDEDVAGVRRCARARTAFPAT